MLTDASVAYTSDAWMSTILELLKLWDYKL
jgi:hypothetical protein